MTSQGLTINYDVTMLMNRNLDCVL